jgi:anaerobic ribonucleoside-triphosphate reductase
MNEQMLCHDCGKILKVEKEEIVGGKILVYNHNDKKIEAIKCDACYKKNASLSNFQKCEVYSRIVGYIRPVSQWNMGKQQEYTERKMYEN